MGKVYIGNVKGGNGKDSSITATENTEGVLVTATSGDGTVTTAQLYNGSAVRPDGGKFYISDGNIPNNTDTSTYYECNGFGQTITDITCQEGINNIGKGAFSKMTSLKTITFSENDNPVVKSYAFYNDTSMTDNNIIPYSVEEYAFCNCSNLKEIDLSKVNSIGSYAFSDDISLTDLTIGNSETPLSLDNKIFLNVKANITFNSKSISTTSNPFYYSSAKKVTVSELWNTIPAGLFYVNQGSIDEIDLQNVTVLESQALCNSYAEVDLTKITEIGVAAIANVHNTGTFENVKVIKTGINDYWAENNLSVNDEADLSNLEYMHTSNSNYNYAYLNAKKIILSDKFKGYDSSSISSYAGKICWSAFGTSYSNIIPKVIMNSSTPIPNYDYNIQYVDIYVPDDSLDDWKAVTTSNFASRMHKMSELV